MNGSPEGVSAAIRRHGGIDKLPEVMGERIEEFAPVALSEAIEREVRHALIVGYPKISLHMDVTDAARLAAFLRR